MSQKFITVLLAMLLGIQAIATDLYLSALPSMQAALVATIGQTQLTLSAMMLSFGVSQLFLGPLSDRFGRKPVLLWGVALFTLSGLATALASSITWLIALRALQGVGVGAAVMSGRAVLRGLFAMVMSKAFTGLGFIALASAALGSVAAEFLGWRSTLVLMALFGLVLWIMLFMRFQETIVARNLKALKWRTLGSNWLTILSHPAFLTYSMLSAFSFCSMINFLAGSSFVFIKMLGLSKLQYGLCLFFMPISYITGTFYCRYLLKRYGLQRAVKRATWLTLVPGLLLGTFIALGVQTVWSLLAPFYMFMVGHGVMQSSGQTGSVAHFPSMAGTASALNGFLMMLLGFATTLWLGAHLVDNAVPMMAGMAFFAVMVSLVAWFVVPKFGKLPK
jgi:MFS transporter, DHA1 family, multidrug resistance protein